MLKGDSYHLIKNVTLPNNHGTTQIDHIIISIFGIFVIETKNYSGKIYGEEHQSTWRKVIHHRTYEFQNPLFQNETHTRVISKLINIDRVAMNSLVVFVGSCKLMSNLPNNVVKWFNLIRYIKSKKVPLFTESQVENMLHTIEKNRIPPSVLTNWRHIQFVKKRIAR